MWRRLGQAAAHRVRAQIQVYAVWTTTAEILRRTMWSFLRHVRRHSLALCPWRWCKPRHAGEARARSQYLIIDRALATRRLENEQLNNTAQYRRVKQV